MLAFPRYLTAISALVRAAVDPRTWRSRLNTLYWQRVYARRAPGALQHLGNLRQIVHVSGGVDLQCDGGVLRVELLSAGVARVRLCRAGVFPPRHSYALINDPPPVPAIVTDGDGVLLIQPREAADPTGSLRISATTAPCRLTFTDGAGRVLVADAAGAGWQDGGVRCVQRLPGDAAIYGLGEKAFGLNHRGRRLVMWNTDPKGGRYRQGSDPLYQSVPFLVQQRSEVAHGLLFDNIYRAEFDLGQGVPGELAYQADGGELCYYVLTGPTIPDVLARYADLTGHMALPPRWALGYHQSRWSYASEAEVRQVARELRGRRIPCDAIYLDIDHMDGFRVFTWDRARFPDPAGLLADLRAAGLRVVTIIDPGVKIDPRYFVCAEGLARELFCKLADGRLYSGPVWPGECYFPDFSSGDVRAWWGELYRPLLEAGVAGFWNDMNEPAVFPGITFPDAVQHNADPGPTDHRALHNVYGQLMVRASADGLRRLQPDERPFLISRAAYAGIQRDALVWTGDNSSDWEHLRLCIPMVLNLGLSGQPFAGPDVGGFNGDADGELLARWTQVGAFMPFFRNHNSQGNRPQEPYAFGEPYEAICRRYIELRYRLLPYIYTAFWQAAETGLPVARALALAFPGDRRVASVDDAYLFGDAFLVAPLMAPGGTGRAVYLPAGGWYDFWTGTRYDGPTDIPAQAPLDVLPLYARAGSVVPMGPVMQHTDQFVPERLTLHVFAGDAESLLYEDDGLSMAHRKGARRVTRFVSRLTDEELTLTRSADGTYDPGYLGYDLVLRGGVPREKSVWVDGRAVEDGAVDEEWDALRVQAGMFERITIR